MTPTPRTHTPQQWEQLKKEMPGSGKTDEIVMVVSRMKDPVKLGRVLAATITRLHEIGQDVPLTLRTLAATYEEVVPTELTGEAPDYPPSP
jgi:hypothetical protein